MTFSLNTAQGRLEIPGEGTTVDLIGALRGGTLEWSTSAVSELHLEFEDRRCEILRAGALSCGTKSGSSRGTLISLGGRAFEVRSFEHQADGTLIVDARGARAVAMRRSDRGIGVETTANISPSKWVERVGNWYGLRVHAQETPVRDQITRQGEADNKPAESDWDVCQRLAGEEGMLCFEADGVLSFGKPSYLINRPAYPKLRVEMRHDPELGPVPIDPRIFTRPAPHRSSDSDVAVASWSIEADAPFAMGLGSVGWGAQLIGYAPQFDGEYLVTSVRFPLDDQGVATLTCSTPVDPVPTGQATATAGGATGVGVSSGAIRSPGPGRYATTSLDGAQMLNATTIVKVGLGMGVPTKGLVVAIATALQESTLRNLNYGDRDSLGLFQQRPSQGWGTPQQVQDPAYAARKFYEALLKVPGWQSMAVTDAAQAVQRSGFPQAYAKWAATAEAVVSAILATGKAASSASPAAAASPRARAVAFARAQIGKPYQWGGTGNPSYDCSGLTQAAYKSVGVDITRTTYTQLANDRLQRVALSDLQVGDLWYPHTGHVQIVSVAAGSKSRVVEAQQDGIPILEGPIWGLSGQGRRVPV